MFRHQSHCIFVHQAVQLVRTIYNVRNSMVFVLMENILVETSSLIVTYCQEFLYLMSWAVEWNTVYHPSAFCVLQFQRLLPNSRLLVPGTVFLKFCFRGETPCAHSFADFWKIWSTSENVFFDFVCGYVVLFRKFGFKSIQKTLSKKIFLLAPWKQHCFFQIVWAQLN